MLSYNLCCPQVKKKSNFISSWPSMTNTVAELSDRPLSLFYFPSILSCEEITDILFRHLVYKSLLLPRLSWSVMALQSASGLLALVQSSSASSCRENVSVSYEQHEQLDFDWNVQNGYFDVQALYTETFPSRLHPDSITYWFLPFRNAQQGQRNLWSRQLSRLLLCL